MAGLVRELLRPYRGWLAIVLAAMLVETAMSLAAPWPLKVVIDNVLGGHPLPEWLRWLARCSRRSSPRTGAASRCR
jgi:subfamily B ATP-binding cassette protein MsbA